MRKLDRAPLFLLFGAIALDGASAQILAAGPDPDWVSQAKIIAQMEGISVGDAVSRTILQNKIVDEAGRLSSQPGFAGAWIERGPTGFHAHFPVKRGNPHPHIADKDVAASSDSIEVDRSLADLERDRANIIDELRRAKIPGAIALRVDKNDLTLTTPNPGDVKNRIAAGTLAIPVYVIVEQGSPRVGLEATVTGSGRMDNATTGAICTGGFTVTYNGNRGISTAGHCVPNDMQTHRGLPAGTAYPYWTQSNYDVGVYSSSSNTYINRVTLGDGSYYTITTVAPSMVVNAAVCIIKRDGTQQCGYIAETAFSGTDSSGTPYGPWVRVDRYLTQGGDSGSPWLYGGKAYGSHEGFGCPVSPSTCYSTFIGTPAITALGVTINTN